MPGKAKGTIRGHKTTATQQRLFGAARGVQESGKKAFSSANKIARSIPAGDLHNIAKKPKGGYRKLK